MPPPTGPISPIRFEKSIAQLPATLTSSTLYAVRVGEGFDLYISDLTGNIAYRTNATIGPTGYTGSASTATGYTGSQGEIGPAPATTVYTAQSMTLTNGVYVSGDVTSIQNFNDGQRYALTDGSLTGPAWIVNVDFTEVTSFNQVDLNISYTVSSGHTVFIQLYNNVTEGWDNIGSYNGLAGYQQFQLGVISGTSYINSGTVLLRLYHNNTGNPAHQTFIDYVAIVDSIAGGQGPRGATGYTGSTGTQGVIGYTGSTGTQGIAGYTGSVGYTGSTGTQGEIGYTGSSGLLGNIGLYDSINDTVSGTVNNISSLNFDSNSGFSLTDLGSGSVNVRVAISASSTTSPLKTFNIIGEFGILTGTARYFPSTEDTIASAIISTGSMATQDIVAGLYRNGEFVQFFIIPAGQYFAKYRSLNISIFPSEFYTVNMVGGQGKDLSLALYNTNIQ